VIAELTNWLVNAFNGEWLRTENPVPLLNIDGKKKIKMR
jgi:dipeptidyl aminopeptidase